MTLILLSLLVCRSADLAYRPDVDTAWCQDREVPFLPAPGDDVELWKWDETGAGPCWPARCRVWRADGRVEVELATIQVDYPAGEWLPDSRRVWLTEDGERVEDLLAEHGWRRYRDAEAYES